MHSTSTDMPIIDSIGLLSIQRQLAAMGPLIVKYQECPAGAASDFSNTIATSITTNMYDEPVVYAGDVKTRLNAIQPTSAKVSLVDAIEDALTVLHHNLIVNISHVNDTVIVLSPEHMNEATGSSRHRHRRFRQEEHYMVH
ncbi:hypothetical protein Hypma_003923 [Hypsizygus marmoreus]|uniref:Uncharacterized protein n=1 Tax=Hypsizygus marmoreus TaxID=39966 RepID=A0A369J124_HYPMA|nr:hypothetical protein Hypma_003923 [Hypsizygus marmoreus]